MSYILQPEKCELLVVDMQPFGGEEFSTGYLGPAVPYILELLRRLPSSVGRTLVEYIDTEDCTTIPVISEAAPKSRLIRKTTADAFESRSLCNLLQDAGRDTIILTGQEASHCIAATTVGAISNGYRVVAVSDACIEDLSSYEWVDDFRDYGIGTSDLIVATTDEVLKSFENGK